MVVRPKVMLGQGMAIIVTVGSKLACDTCANRFDFINIFCYYIYIDRDGSMSGYDVETIKYASKLLNIPLIASGGAGGFDNMLKLVNETNVSALAAASIYHFTVKTPLDVKKFLINNNVSIRM